ncbi:hypothetical protein V3C99_009756, partial [Haemonchus contortus]
KTAFNEKETFVGMNPRQSQILAFGALLCLLLDSGFALSDKGRASLAKALKGVDLEQRRERLRKLQGADLDVTLVGASPKIVQNVQSKTSFPGGASIVEKNWIEGVGDYMYEGDINLTEEQLSALEASLNSDNPRQKRQAAKVNPIWANKKVFYYFDASFGATMKALVKRTLAYLAARTCLTFTESSTAANRIRVFSGSGCYSNVGMSGGEQALSLADGCNTMGIVAHEFMHALGIFHMQSRYDRDSFVTINLTNVPEESRHNYNKYTSAQTVNYTPYEFGSVMHYDAKSFATTGESMIPKNARFLYTIGSQMISFYDLSMINTHYKCNAKCTTGAKCVNGGKRNPKNCATCICPAGYGGALCNQRPAGCGAVLTAAATWKTRKIVQGNDTDTDIRQAHAICNDWIKAPTGKKVQVKVTALNGVYCQYGCWVQGIEFKTLANKLNTNPKSCCQNHLNQLLTSALNPTPVITYNIFLKTEITYAYKYI